LLNVVDLDLILAGEVCQN